MLETLVAAIMVMFVPTMLESYTMPGGLMGALVLTKVVTVLAIMLITMLTNITRAWRFCKRGKDGSIQSYGISYGLKKGFWCGAIAVAGATAIGFIPILRAPFTVISIIPGLGSMVDGFMLSILYLLSYMIIAYPIWGSC